MENERDLQLENLDRARREYLDKLFLGVPERICSYGERSYVAQMSPEEVKRDYDEWMKVLEKVKRNGTIEDIILIIRLMKQSKALINSFSSFCPIDNLFSFFDAGEGLFGIEYLGAISMKIFETYLRLGLEEEEELILNNQEIMKEITSRCQNPGVVNYFNEKLGQ